jgi:hypothetical protein
MAEYCVISYVMMRILFRVFRNSYFPLTWSFRSLWSRMRFVVGLIIISDLPGFLGASFSGSVFYAPVVSVSSSEMLGLV